MPNLLVIIPQCTYDTFHTVFAARMAMATPEVRPGTSAVKSLSHFVSCFIRQWSNAYMQENDAYNVYVKSGVGATAGVLKYGLRDGFTPKSILLGGFNNLAYHMAPEINKAVFGGTNSTAYDFAVPIVVEIAENLLNVACFQTPSIIKKMDTDITANAAATINKRVEEDIVAVDAVKEIIKGAVMNVGIAFTDAIKNGAKLGLLIDLFGNAKAFKASFDTVADYFTGGDTVEPGVISLMTINTNTEVLGSAPVVHDEL